MFRRCCLVLGCALGLAGSGWTGQGGETVSFRNDVMPLLSKAGCNTGPCHGNANGKAGFKLSLRGESPELDFAALTREQLARRVNVFAPEESLVLLKATTQLAHEGGLRFTRDSKDYGLLRQWVAEGARDDAASAPVLDRLEVSPSEVVLVEPAREVRIRARAHFKDGSSRDLATVAVYEPSGTLVTVSADGLVEAGGFGEVTVLVRYLQMQRPVRLAFVPARPDFRWTRPAENNFIDRQVFAKLRRLRMNPSGICGDELFARRAYLDLLGIPPTAEEARRFVVARAKGKRAQLVEELLGRPEFADFWALKWMDLLRAEERILDRKGVVSFHRWVRQAFAENKPLDEFARELISARGSTYLNPAANYYRANREVASRAEAAAQVFLGTRLQCAQCHSHPFDRWTQDDYYDWARVFARVDYKVLENRRRDENDKHEFKGEQIVFMAAKSDYKNARTGRPAEPRFLGAAQPAGAEVDELEALAAWVTAPKNPFFAKAQANRIWFHLMGRGLVDPIDDFRATNPASHPELLEELAGELARGRFDVRRMIRLIMNSRAYQLSAEPNGTNGEDEWNYSRTVPRRLTAEQLLDAQAQVAGAPVRFIGQPEGTRAAQLPGALAERKRDQRQTEVDTFLAEFGKPARLLPTECERLCDPTMSQAFQLISGPALNELLTRTGGRIDGWAKSGEAAGAVIEELFWTALTRAPSAAELEKFSAHLAAAPDRRAGLEDLAWSLLNAKEFLFRR